MDVRLPHRVVYKVGEIVPVEEVIGTLQANQLLSSELGQMLERLFPGLIVEKAKLEVRTIETGSLREYFFLAFVVTFQEDLKEEVPALLEQWAGLPVSDQYDSLVTAIVMVMLFYGADYIYRRFIRDDGSKQLNEQISMLVAELSLATGRPETLIKIDLQDQFQKASKIGELGKAAIKFFRPSRSQKNEPIVVGTRLINSQIVGEVPNQIDVEALEEADRFKNIPGVRVEIHAKDRDKGNTGWAGVVPTVSHRRTKLVLGAGVAPEVLWDSETVWADVVVFYKADKEGNEMPSQIHIQRILDSPNLSAED